MSVLFASGANNSLSTGANLSNPQSCTKLIWMKASANPASYQNILIQSNNAVSAYNNLYGGGGSGSTHLVIDDASNSKTFPLDPTWQNWTCYAYTVTAAGAGSLIGYWQDNAGGGWTSASTTGANFTIGIDKIAGTNSISMTMAYYMEWSVVLSVSDLNTQFNSSTPVVQLGSLRRYCPLATGATAATDTQNGYNFNVSGSLSTGASSPTFAINGVAAITEVADVAVGAGTNSVFGIAAIVEQGDVVTGIGAATGLVGYAYTIYSTTYAGGGQYWLGLGSSPPPVLGDSFLVQSVTSPGGYTNQVNSDGTGETLVGFDTSRQSFKYYIFRQATQTLDGPGTIWINEVLPIWSTGPLPTNWIIGTPIAPFDLVASGYCFSPSADVLTFAIAGGALPSGLVLSPAGVVSGTPTGGSSIVTLSATDYTGQSSISPLLLFIASQPSQGTITPPPPVTIFRNIPKAAPSKRIIDDRSLVFGLAGAEQPYPVYQFSGNRVRWEYPGHNPFLHIPPYY